MCHLNFMKNFLSKLKNTVEKTQSLFNAVKIFPGLVVLCGVISGNSQDWRIIGITLALALLLLNNRHKLIFIASLALSSALIFNVQNEPVDQGLKISDKPAAATIQVRISDSSCTGQTLSWLPPPKTIKAEITAVKFTGETEFKPSSGSIIVSVKDLNPFYGDYLELSGVFRSPRHDTFYQKTILKNNEIEQEEKKFEVIGFDYAKFLKNRGIKTVFYGTDYRIVNGHLSTVQNIYRQILGFRGKILNLFTCQLRSEDNKGMIATLLFGIPHGVSRETRKSFIFSGTVHLFTVSGLHVGMLALLIGLCLRPLPFKTRHLLIPVAVFGYVAATGMSAPSMRAFLMIALWSWSRAFLLWTPGLNMILLAAAILLLYNPGYLYDMGFQYSFIVVIFLMISSRGVAGWRELAFERLRWIPRSYRPLPLKIKLKLLGNSGEIVLGGTTAWLAGSVLSLYYQSIVFPLSIAVNILLIPLIWPLYPLILLAPCSETISAIIEFILESMRSICQIFYLNFDNLSCVRPAVWMMVLFFAAFAVLLTCRKALLKIGSLMMILALFGLWRWQALNLPQSLLIITGGGAAPMLLFTNSDQTIAINTPSYGASNVAASLLRQRGINQIEKIFFTGTLKSYSGGSARIFNELKVGEIVIPQWPKKRDYLSRILRGTAVEQIPISIDKFKKTEFIIGKPHNRIEYRYAGFNINVDIIEIHPGRTRFILNRPGLVSYTADVINSNILEVNEYVFK